MQALVLVMDSSNMTDMSTTKPLTVESQLESVVALMQSQFRQTQSQLAEIKNVLNEQSREIVDLKDTFKKVSDVEKKVDRQEVQLNDLKKENKELREHLLSQEYQSRRDNLQFVGYEENKNENPEKRVLDTLLKIGIDIGERGIVRAHRVGPYSARRTRPILVKFFHYKDRETVWTMKQEITQQSHINIYEDWPKELLARRRILFPIFHAARLEKNQTGNPKNKVTMARDK